MREAGVEPARAEAHKILSLARLPIPPLPHTSRGAFVAPTHRQVKDLSAVSRQSPTPKDRAAKRRRRRTEEQGPKEQTGC